MFVIGTMLRSAVNELLSLKFKDIKENKSKKRYINLDIGSDTNINSPGEAIRFHEGFFIW